MVIFIMLVMVNVAINDAEADFDNGSNCKLAIMHNNYRCFKGSFFTNWIGSNESRGDIAVASWYFPVLIIEWFCYHNLRKSLFNISMKRSKCITLTHDLQIETAGIDWMI